MKLSSLKFVNRAKKKHLTLQNYSFSISSIYFKPNLKTIFSISNDRVEGKYNRDFRIQSKSCFSLRWWSACVVSTREFRTILQTIASHHTYPSRWILLCKIISVKTSWYHLPHFKDEMSYHSLQLDYAENWILLEILLRRYYIKYK